MQVMLPCDLAKIGKLGLLDGKARVVQLARLSNGLRITVNSQQAAIFRQSFKNGARVTAAPKGAIQVESGRIVHQCLHSTVQQYAGMTKAVSARFNGRWRHALP